MSEENVRKSTIGKLLCVGFILCLSGGGASATKLQDSKPAQGESGGKSTSRIRAIGASILLPGLGHRSSGHNDRAKAFMAAEAAIVIGYFASQVQGYVRKQGYIEYAEMFGGVDNAGAKPDWYYRNLGQYQSSDDYEASIARTARAIHGDDLAAREEYVARNKPAPDEAWEWVSQNDRREFRERRKSSRNAYRRASLFVGAALLNRLVSAVDAARLAGGEKSRSTVFYRPEKDGNGYLCVQWTLD